MLIFRTLSTTLCLISLILAAACTPSPRKELPILGPQYEEEIKGPDGQMQKQMVYHHIPDFTLLNQLGDTVTKANLKDKIIIADFFFTTCPTICPVMKTQMLALYEKLKGRPDILFMSHSIDAEHDSVAVLKDYAERLDADPARWLFLTWPRDGERMYDLAQKGYLVTAQPEAEAPGGYIHDGAFILIDKEQRIRGYYDGTKTAGMNALLQDLQKLAPADEE